MKEEGGKKDGAGCFSYDILYDKYSSLVPMPLHVFPHLYGSPVDPQETIGKLFSRLRLPAYALRVMLSL